MLFAGSGPASQSQILGDKSGFAVEYRFEGGEKRLDGAYLRPFRRFSESDILAE